MDVNGYPFLTLRTNGMNFKRCEMWHIAGCWFVNKKILNPWRYVSDSLALKETIIRNWKVDLKIPFENVAIYRIC